MDKAAESKLMPYGGDPEAACVSMYNFVFNMLAFLIVLMITHYYG
jgi:hypothetical protein